MASGVVDPAPSSTREELAQFAVEVGHLQAHLRAVLAVAVADLVGGRQADRQQVEARPAAELSWSIGSAARRGIGSSSAWPGTQTDPQPSRSAPVDLRAWIGSSSCLSSGDQW